MSGKEGCPLNDTRILRQSVVLAIVYVVAGKLGLRLAFVNASASGVWPATGIALAAFLILGYRIWPAILCGAFLVNVTTAVSAATSIGIGVGNTLEALLGAYLVDRFAHGRRAFFHARDTFRFVVLAAILSTTVSPTIGLTSLAAGGFAPRSDYGSIWLTWWLGDAIGALVVAPAIVLWSVESRMQWSRQRAIEGAGLLLCLVLVSLIVFGGLLPPGHRGYPLEFLCIPLLLWVGFRFTQREVATALVVLSGIALVGTLRGFGPFVAATANGSILLLQSFMGVTTMMSLALAVAVSERRRVEEQLRHLAVSDPLTGLANYRQLIEALESEIARSQGTGLSFAVLFLDLDGLKKINDRHGHLVGNRALCRLADAMRSSSRARDLGARFGGDEFALVLPETEEDAAQQVGARVADQLAAWDEKPALTVSTGVAVYPRDGDTVEALLGAADTVLYEAKQRGALKSGRAS